MLPCKQRAWQSGWALCISPGKDLWVHDGADTASRLGIRVREVHNPAAANMPLMLRRDLGGGCRGAEADSRLYLLSR